MAYFDAAAGAATLRIEANVGAVSGNSSRVDWGLYLYCYNGQSFHLNNNIGWSVSIGGVPGSGTFNFDFRSTKTKVIATGSVWIGHDANGYATIGVSGFKGVDGASAVADNVTASGTMSLPRIPKPPVQNGAPTVSNLLPTSVTLSWPANTNNNGASIDQYLLRVRNGTPADAAGYVDYPVDAATFAKAVTGLTPGTTYYSVVYAHNAQGYSVKSAETSFRTPSGMYPFNGSEFRPSEVLTRNATNTDWTSGEVLVRNNANTTWNAAS